MVPLFRLTAWCVLVAFTASLFPPVLKAQTTNYGSNYYTAGNFDTVRNQVYSDLSMRQTLEAQYKQADQRAKDLKAQLDQLERQRPADGQDQSWWTQKYNEVKNYFSQNDNVLNRTKEQLSTVYNRLETNRQNTMKSDNPQFQQLGDVIGAAGASQYVFPINIRPTAGEMGASAGQLIRQGRVATINARVGADGTGGVYNWAGKQLGAMGEAGAASATNIRNTKWEAVPTSNGQGTVLRPRNLETGQFGTGSIRVPKDLVPGTRPYNDFVSSQLSLQNSHFNVTRDLNLAQSQLRSAVGTKGEALMKSRVESLTAKKAALEADIQKFNNETPDYAKPGQQVKTVAISAAKWAAMSTAITVGSNVVHQLGQNGWDPSKINWSQATADLRTPQFWGGTAGSFVGSWGASMIASALPGGPFVKALFAVGGAALGWQVGSGNLKNTDWTMLGATTVGSTIGMLIGQTVFWFAPGLGAIIGGIAGNWLATKLVNWVRNSLCQPTATTWDHADTSYTYNTGGTDTGKTGYGSDYTGSSPANTGYSYGTGGADSSQAASIKRDYDKAYRDWIAAQQDPNVPREQVSVLHQAYLKATEALRKLQAANPFK